MASSCSVALVTGGETLAASVLGGGALEIRPALSQHPDLPIPGQDSESSQEQRQPGGCG